MQTTILSKKQITNLGFTFFTQSGGAITAVSPKGERFTGSLLTIRKQITKSI